ncbi:helix-turn-helix domain-containing protein [Rhodopseudomonas palustris]|uniref:helix-turn-helix domain-containing protein n=1 Tax=Rhodopseudomonas palustris TaxID=1076 RepID=UPI0021F29D20|nr:helix-turn-helix transcriptional regulator [Rhodopseudomonas palustris]UYO55204.1 helix-turn-helix domain-containing protein [Rhodopseudomonas palustris]
MRSKRDELRRTAIGEIGSGNVFADLGLPDADNLLLKSRLVSEIDEVIEKRGLTETEAGQLMGLSQPHLSDLRNGLTQDYTIEQLDNFLGKLSIGPYA